jgi:hypothetical protein
VKQVLTLTGDDPLIASKKVPGSNRILDDLDVRKISFQSGHGVVIACVVNDDDFHVRIVLPG